MNKELRFITDILYHELRIIKWQTLNRVPLYNWILVVLGILVLLSLFEIRSGAEAEVSFLEYQRYVHNYLNSEDLGNWTYLEKPMFPVCFNVSQIAIGNNWSIVTPLKANHSYHVYFYGEWTNNSPQPLTDYDIYVYNPLGSLEGYHTESAGLPEHLGTSVNEPFFVPTYSGNYTFVIRNDARESKAAQKATFMIIENIELNIWHEHYVEGKNSDNLPVFNTSWAYEFVTESQRVEVHVRVPQFLDMYEVRLYLMANPDSKVGTVLNDIPLAWELGLYEMKNGKFGAYNLESKEDRGVAYASCEFYGQEMRLNFTSSCNGKSLYHLVFIGEAGYGTVQFLIKTEFGNTHLEPLIVPTKVYPFSDTKIAYNSSLTDLTNATLKYSTNQWQDTNIVQMDILNKTICESTILGQPAGTFVNYTVEAIDTIENILKANGSFFVKYASTLNITLQQKIISIGQNVTIKGCLTPSIEDLPITVTFTSTNQTKQVKGQTFENGTFVVSFGPETSGTWTVQAVFDEDEFRYGIISPQLTFKAEEQSIFSKYSLYIGGGLGAAVLIGIIVYARKARE